MDWTEIILAVIALIGAVLTGVVVPYLKSKLSADQLETLDYWLRVLIAAAETEFKGAGMGEQKKQWVIKELAKTGLKFDESEVSNAIDGLCRELTASAVIN